MKNKQTERFAEGGKTMSSIEYYKESIDYLFERYIESEVEEDELISRKDSIFKEIEEIHKQEIMYAVDYGILLYVNDPITSEDYYNETFKNQEDGKV